MTIPETQAHIRKSLEVHNYFGLTPEQFTFMDQFQVPAVLNIKGEIDFNEQTGELNNKPHGHGESHLLMHTSGMAKKLKEDGFEWIIFFNDTNPLAFRFLPSYIGIANEHKWETIYVCVKRKPGEAVGAICEVEKKDGSTIITNVEYNVLEKLGKNNPEPVDAEGYSTLPGNINLIIVSLETYADSLKAHEGFVPEFINPKVEPDGFTLKSPTRMETLISEYTYLLPNTKRVGAIQVEKLMCFSCAKNEMDLGRQRQSKDLSIETCASCQFEYYDHNRLLLEKLGAKVEQETELSTFEGLKYNVGPRIILHPSFACTFRDLEASIHPPVTVSSKSFLEIDGKAYLKDFVVDGSVRIINKTDKPVSLEGKHIRNQSFITFNQIQPDVAVYYDDKIRGFSTHNKEHIEVIIPDV